MRRQKPGEGSANHVCQGTLWKPAEGSTWKGFSPRTTYRGSIQSTAADLHTCRVQLRLPGTLTWLRLIQGITLEIACSGEQVPI